MTDKELLHFTKYVIRRTQSLFPQEGVVCLHSEGFARQLFGEWEKLKAEGVVDYPSKDQRLADPNHVVVTDGSDEAEQSVYKAQIEAANRLEYGESS